MAARYHLLACLVVNQELGLLFWAALSANTESVAANPNILAADGETAFQNQHSGVFLLEL